MEITFYQVDAFASSPFTGNPAAVMVLEKWLDEAQMQNIAAEMNLSETAFVVAEKTPGTYGIRWFTPKAEIDLCGHATLASAHVLRHHCNIDKKNITFKSASGQLHTQQIDEQRIELDFPACPGTLIPTPGILTQALNAPIVATYDAGSRYVVIFENSEQVASLTPIMPSLCQLPPKGFSCSAIGTGDYADSDFVCRHFAPKIGIDEDPVTGSAYTSLVPYYAEQLHKTQLSARQLSARGGELTLAMVGDRVKISGQAITVIKGQFFLPD